MVLIAGASGAQGRLNSESALKPTDTVDRTGGGGGKVALTAASFVLTSNKVTNPNAPELTIDAAGGKATWDHTGQYGGAGKGGEWKVDYTFKVPQTLIAGKSFSLTLGLAVSNAVPVQPLLIQMGARAPDFVGSVSANYPNPASASKTFSVPLSAGYKDFKEIVIIVGVVSAEVTYVYRRVGAAPSGALVGTSFDGGTTQPSIDLLRAPEPVVISTETANTAEALQLTVSVTGNGIVVTVGRFLSRNGGGAAPISCGLNRFLCYARLEPQQRVTLQARPLPGYRFRAWTGACAGQGPSCTVSATALRTVTAVFAPRNPGAAIALNVRSPNLSVRWAQGVGNGALVVRGSVARRSRLVVQVRRPGGGPLLFKYLSASGAFTQTMSLRPSQLPPGAKLFPGGFVVSVTGTSGGFQLPLQLRTVVLRSPSEGVVRQAFSSASREGGAQLRFPRGTKEVWANFRFATQPLKRMPVTVTWYRPNGSKLGTVVKANRPEVESFMVFGPGLPSGLWTAELRAGGRVAKRLAVRIS